MRNVEWRIENVELWTRDGYEERTALMSTGLGVKESEAFKALIKDVREKLCVVKQNREVRDACRRRQLDGNSISTIEALVEKEHVAFGNQLSDSQDEYVLLYDDRVACPMRKFLDEVKSLLDRRALVLSGLTLPWVKELRRAAKTAFPQDQPKEPRTPDCQKR